MERKPQEDKPELAKFAEEQGIPYPPDPEELSELMDKWYDTQSVNRQGEQSGA